MQLKGKSLGAIALGLAVIVVAGCGSSGGSPSSGSGGSKAPITIAMFADTSGGAFDERGSGTVNRCRGCQG